MNEFMDRAQYWIHLMHILQTSCTVFFEMVQQAKIDCLLHASGVSLMCFQNFEPPEFKTGFPKLEHANIMNCSSYLCLILW